jgi:hypothetical protein
MGRQAQGLHRVPAALALVLALAAEAGMAQAIVIGAEDDAAPWSYADGTGYANDVVRLAFDRAGWKAQLKVMPYARCKALVLSGDIAACFSVSRAPDLEGRLLFPQQSLFQARNLLVAAASSPLSGCDASKWPSRPLVGIVRGYEYRRAVEAVFANGQAIADPGDSEVSSLRKVRAGHVDAALVTVDPVKRLEFVAALAGVAADFKLVCDFGGDPAYVAFSRRHPQGPAAAAAFDAGMQALQQQGAVDATQQDWRTRLARSSGAKKH